ncbi:MAG: hypothetical protein N2517_09230 [Ignavibacteria bacterium]|nr:hypothetical protein [Ignavibacteria bacterium]
MNRITVSLLLLLNFAFATSQNYLDLFNWNIHTSLVDIISGTIDGEGNIWCATTGGVFYYNPSNNSFKDFNFLNGPYSTEIKYIQYNARNKEIYVGAYDGTLSIFNANGKWENILDIKKSRYERKEINHIYFVDTIAIISASFGLTTFDINRRIFLKTPPRLGDFPSGTPVRYAIIFKEWLWVATENGIARISLGQNLSFPENWKTYANIEGLDDQDIHFLAIENDTLFAFTKKNIYKFDGSKFVKLFRVNDEIITNVQTVENKIYFSTNYYIADLKLKKYYHISESPFNELINTFIFNKKQLIIFPRKGGIYIKNFDEKISYTRFYPNAPYSNQFTYFDIDGKGGLWVATNTDPRGEGFMYFYNGKWINFNTNSFPALPTNFFMKLTCADETTYVSSAGRGLLAVFPDKDTFSFKIYNQNNSPLTGIVNDPNWVVVQQTAYQKNKSLLWIVNFSVQKTGYLLIAKDKNDTFYGFLETKDREYQNILIDEYGTKWISSSNGTGFYFFNEQNTLEDTSDDISGNLAKLTSLPSAQVRTMAYDQLGYIWCGTPFGLFIILNPNAVLKGNVPVIKKLKILTDYSINSIYIDPLNNKWIATNSGIFVISPDGTEILSKITSENAPLLSDEVLHIKANPKSGTFYFGTNKGLITASTLIVQPDPTYNISLSPQPFDPKFDNYLIIEGLAPDTEIKILTINGEIVRTLNTGSKKVLWDGKDDNGNFVASGIYLLLANSLTTNESSVRKIAVIRR